MVHMMKQSDGTQKSETKTSYRVQAVDRALDILDCFSFQQREWSLSEMVVQTGLNKTTVKRMLSNLCDRGYLKQDPRNKRYQLGMKLLELGGIVFSSINLRRAATSHLDRLREDTGMTVLFAVEREDQLIFIDEREGDGLMRLSSCIGLRRNLHYGVLGMVLMAYMPNERITRILQEHPLEEYTPNSLTDLDAFSLRLAQIRADGYVVEKGEALPGFCGIGAPVRDYNRQVVAAVGIAVPLSPDNHLRGEKKMVQRVRSAAEAISTDLGYLKV